MMTSLHEFPIPVYTLVYIWWNESECSQENCYLWSGFEGEISLYRNVRQQNEAFWLEVKLVCVMLNGKGDFHEYVTVRKLKFSELILVL